jgi:hypothetical protein
LVLKLLHDAAVPLHAPGAHPAAEAHSTVDKRPHDIGVPAHTDSAIGVGSVVFSPPHAATVDPKETTAHGNKRICARIDLPPIAPARK